MVLSNKKLKQKLRAELAQSFSSSVSKSEPKNDGNEAKPLTQSLKVLLDSATQRPRLSKREKNRRKNQSEDSNNDEEDENEVEKKKMGNGSEAKKRKRDEKDGVLGSNVKETEKSEETKKKKNPKKKNKIKKGKNEEVKKETVEIGNEAKGAVETNENIDNSEEIGIESTKVYVGGIPFYSTEDDIRSYFEACGTITEVDCMTFPESGKFRGIAIINFKTEAAAKRALALDGSDMGGLFLTILPYKSNRTTTNVKASIFSPKAVEGYNRIYVGNLSWDITEDDLKNFLSGCKISSIKFGKDKDSGEFRGYAHIDFFDNLSFTMALKLDQKIVCGRPAKISCAVPLKMGATDRERIDQSDQRSEVKAITEEVTTKVTVAEVIEPISVSIKTETNSNANIETSAIVSTGKMRRRTCYECGGKGHISSDCPKKIVD